MVLELAYQVIKDVVALATLNEVDPIDPGTGDAAALAQMGIIEAADARPYTWSAPRNLFARTEAPDAAHEIVWVTDKLRRTKRKVVRFTHDGVVDLVLVRKKDD